MNHPLQLELAKLLIEYIPSAELVRFLKTGTEATQGAVRLARCITGRTYVASHGYHGWVDMWRPGQTKGIQKETWEVIPLFDGTAEGLEKLLSESEHKFAAVIICPVDAKPFTKENFQGIIDVAHRHGALAIFDEVKSGFRTALGGAQEYLGVVPDITCISKGMANGYPLAAVVGKKEYMAQMATNPTVGTFSVEALSIAASIATLRELKEKNVVDHLWKMGQRLIDGLNRIVAKYEMEGVSAYADPVPSVIRFGWKDYLEGDYSSPQHNCFFQECIKHGLFFSSWHVAFVNFSHSEADIDEALDICDQAMAVTKKTCG
jgi:glutamate-1-semialdehyde 2,1-aminomutase